MYTDACKHFAFTKKMILIKMFIVFGFIVI